MANNKIQDAAESGTIFAITVELRPVDKGKMKALADVTITMGDQGTLKALGFPVFSDGRNPHVGSPSRKGTSRYFDTVTYKRSRSDELVG